MMTILMKMVIVMTDAGFGQERISKKDFSSRRTMFRLPAFGWMIMMMMKMAMMTILMKMVIVMTVLIMTLCFDALFLGSLFHLCISLLLILHPFHHANCISEFDSFIILLLIIIHVLSIGNK